MFVSIRSSRAPANPDGHTTDAAAHQFQPRTPESTATQRDIVTRNRDELDVTHSRFARPGTAILRCGRDDPGGRLAPKEIEHAIDAARTSARSASSASASSGMALLLRAGLAARGCDRPRSSGARPEVTCDLHGHAAGNASRQFTSTVERGWIGARRVRTTHEAGPPAATAAARTSEISSGMGTTISFETSASSPIKPKGSRAIGYESENAFNTAFTRVSCNVAAILLPHSSSANRLLAASAQSKQEISK